MPRAIQPRLDWYVGSLEAESFAAMTFYAIMFDLVGRTYQAEGHIDRENPRTRASTVRCMYRASLDLSASASVGDIALRRPCAARRREQSKFSAENYACLSRGNAAKRAPPFRFSLPLGA